MLRRLVLLACGALLVSCAPDAIESAPGDQEPAPVQPECATTDELFPFQTVGEEVGGQCLRAEPLPRLTRDGVSCEVIDAWSSPDQACSCDEAAGRVDVTPAAAAVLAKLRASADAKKFDWNCFCEIRQLSGASGFTCSQEPFPQSKSGFCCVDPMAVPPGNPELTRDCPPRSQRLIRVTGEAASLPMSLASPESEAYVITCDVFCK